MDFLFFLSFFLFLTSRDAWPLPLSRSAFFLSADKTVFSWKTNYSKPVLESTAYARPVRYLSPRVSESRELLTFRPNEGTEKFMQLSGFISGGGRKRVHVCTKGKRRIIRSSDSTVSFDTATTRN